MNDKQASKKESWQDVVWLAILWYGLTGFIVFLTPTKQSIIREGWDPFWTWLASPILILAGVILGTGGIAIMGVLIYVWRKLSGADEKEAEAQRERAERSRLLRENMELKDRVHELESQRHER
jgi:hypothetical protein